MTSKENLAGSKPPAQTAALVALMLRKYNNEVLYFLIVKKNPSLVKNLTWKEIVNKGLVKGLLNDIVFLNYSSKVVHKSFGQIFSTHGIINCSFHKT